MTTQFKTLFSPFHLRSLTLPNRIISSAHGTYMLQEGLQTDQIALYQSTRAAGGVGLIILEATSVHETVIGGPRYAVAVDDGCIPGYRKVFDAIHAHGTAAFVQLYHPGRDDIAGGTTDGTIAPCYSASAVRCEANQLMPRAMAVTMIKDIVQSYGSAARRLVTAGADGIEILAHVTPGSTSTFDGTVHVVPPMAFASGYLSPQFAAIRAKSTKTLCALGFGAGDNLPIGTKGHWLGVLYALGVTTVSLMRLGGFAGNTACFEPTINRQVVPFEGVDTLIVSAGGEAETTLEDSFSAFGGKVLTIGDCLGPRTVEEAILEGLCAGTGI